MWGRFIPHVFFLIYLHTPGAQMYISKLNLTKPTQATKHFDSVIYQNAKAFFDHFNNLNLWYIKHDSNPHVIYHDGIKYKLTSHGVNCEPIDSEYEYIVLDVHGDLVVKVGYVCKPLVYYPNLMKDGKLIDDIEVVTNAPQFPSPIWLKDYCHIKNRSRRKILLTAPTYPVKVGISASANEIKLVNFFQEKHNTCVKVKDRNERQMASVIFHYVSYVL